ncbi:phosphotransferase family protein [Streptomyces iconiensis]|uniref:Aminoglycoside phosphotransferase family protein n=1 Tax=Streptomyces iconiensis TaxID=1384038 RepID=A0ABT7A3H1_9ACTN|nr:aminoglycoside phosphotransferase family protein [Streptomyces iconiensis]MDJ1135889.1 aminoglycoside phosphotransferase family protein [Streptomyces iconiensis]
MTSPRTRPAPSLPLRWHLLRHRFDRDRFALEGHHHRNVVVALREPLASAVGAQAGELGKFRTRLRTPEVVPRAWYDEGAVLQAVSPYLPAVPRSLTTDRRHALHSYVDGAALADSAPPPGPVGRETLRRIAALLASLSDVPSHALPPLPEGWPEEGDSTTFLQHLATFAHEKVYVGNLRRFGALFDALGVPTDAVERFGVEAKRLTPRPYGLLHSDVHRANLVVGHGSSGPGGRLTLVDWENALYGDPLHELATHTVRMEYPPEERARLLGLWRRGMRARGSGHVEKLAAMKRDFALYVDFEHAQSVFPDTMRAALALPWLARDEHFHKAALRVHRALSRARAPLQLTSVPGLPEVGAALRAWHRKHRNGALRVRLSRRSPRSIASVREAFTRG